MRLLKALFILSVFLSQLFSQNSYKVYFNEIRPDDDSTDDAQFVELIGLAGTDLTGMKIIHYNGSESSDGGLWTHTIGNFTITNDCGNGIGFYVLSNLGVTNSDETIPGDLQNGPDGLILYDTDGTTILDAISWEGTGDMTTDDPGTVVTTGLTTANNYLHVTIDDDSGDNSLNAPITVISDDGTGWTINTATPGEVNTTQTCLDILSEVSLPVELSYFIAEKTIEGVLLKWRTESEFNNLGFIIERKTKNSNWQEIISYKNDDTLLGQGTVSYPTDYEYVDRLVEAGNSYKYRLADVDYNGVVTYHAVRTVSVESDPLPAVANNFSISAYPNPFNPSTTIRYSITNNSSTNIAIYDINGRLVTTLLNTEQTAGWHEIQWNGINDDGIKVPTGVYIYRVTVGEEVKTDKLILLQ